MFTATPVNPTKWTFGHVVLVRAKTFLQNMGKVLVVTFEDRDCRKTYIFEYT